ncbi:MAG: hypothetical protein ACXAE3_13595, partial [Candidatus Kariarchaeaceae archaeon]
MNVSPRIYFGTGILLLLLLTSSQFQGSSISTDAPDLNIVVIADGKFGGFSAETVVDMVKRDNGNYLVLIETFSFGSGNSDLWLIELDPSLTILSNQTFGSTGQDEGAKLIATADGGFLIGGTNYVSYLNDDFWLIKLNSTLDVQWERTYGGSANDWLYSVMETDDGTFIAVGTTYSFGVLKSDLWMFKVAADGSMMWNFTRGSSSDDWGVDVVQTAPDTYTVLGVFDPYGTYLYDLWMLNVSSSGVVLAEEVYGNSSDDIRVTNAQFHNGSISYLAKYRPNTGVTQAMLIGEYDLDFTQEFNMTIETVNHDIAEDFVRSDTGEFTIIGTTIGSVPTEEDIWLVHTDADGNPLLNITYGNYGYDYGKAILESNPNQFLIGGLYDSYYDIDDNSNEAWVLDVTITQTSSSISTSSPVTSSTTNQTTSSTT